MKLDMNTVVGGLLFMAIGGVFLLCAGISASNTRNFHATALQAQGTVTGFKETRSRDEDGSESISYYPIVVFTALRTAQGDSLEYRIDEGRKVTFTAGVGSGDKAYEIGETVPVSYAPDAPEDARLDGFVQNWLLAVLLGAFGLVFSGSGVAIMRGAMR